MTRDELAHVLRAACRIADDPQILVIGSQSILGSYAEDDLPEAVVRSIEADLTFLTDDVRKADLVDHRIGELTPFHETFGYYAQGVDLSTAKLPDGWRDRLVRFEHEASAPAHGWCLEPHDLVLSKLVAYRPKDLEFTAALIEAGLIDVTVCLERVEAWESASTMQHAMVRRWLVAAREKFNR